MRLFRNPESGIWYFDFILHGNRIRRSTGTQSKHHASRIAHSEYQKHLESTPVSQDDIFLIAYAERYISDLHSLKKAERTIDIYRRALNNFTAFAGNVKISALHRDDLERYKTYRSELSPTSLNIEIRSIKTAFTYAEAIGLIDVNPFIGVKTLIVPKTKRRKYLFLEEIELLMKKCEGRLGDLIKFLLWTGCRRMSALDLKWEDINYPENTILLRNKPEKYEDYTIPLSDKVMGLLDGMEKTDPVFKISTQQSSKRVKALFRKLDFPGHMTLHNLRHTFASHLVLKGVPLAVVAKLLGQSNIHTAALYTDLLEFNSSLNSINILPY